MSTQYVTEPPPTAAVLINTTAGPVTVSLFAQQTPLTVRNFLQHCLDGDYNGNLFHRVAPGFVIQTGDPTGTGDGGQSIYEDREFERYDKDWANVMKRDVEGEKIVFGDEVHSRLKFNRRGLVGMAKGAGQDGGYGSQFFFTLGDCRAELDGVCTMFGRVEGDGIYNMVKIAEGELIEGTERPMYPEKILGVEIIETPKGAAWEKMSRRIKVAPRAAEEEKPKKKAASGKKKGGKALLSFGGEEGEEGENVVVRPKKAKFNTTLINGGDQSEMPEKTQRSMPASNLAANGPMSANKPDSPSRRSPPPPQRPAKRKIDPSASPSRDEPPLKRRSPSPKRRKPSFHDSTTQLPLRDPESPSHSVSSSSEPDHNPRASHNKDSTSSLQAEIAALKKSMRRTDTDTATKTASKPKSALESLIPATSIRGRRRPRPGQNNEKEDRNALKMLDAFRSRLEKADAQKTSRSTSSPNSNSKSKSKSKPNGNNKLKSNNEHDDSDTPLPPNHKDPKDRDDQDDDDDDDDDEEAQLCDLHFIANCQSCFSYSPPHNHNPATGEGGRKPNHTGENDNSDDDDDDSHNFLSHALTFEKDRLGKDLTWKRKNEEELVVIDPREREKDLGIKSGGSSSSRRGAQREWDRDRDRDRDRNRRK